ncbi:AcrR family transcriptional regulator [Weissella uvarum]|uniref:TetR/AcrR family transcriptional regulator n=1 Tax=Weissella uvarum TaxID=1479233 RepID=UPI0019622664|nr:TetR/AcrR family transcriptional regulator [Weissella uvarum]MBM7616805.1 AcrR family transcriptional regulator [Weissella uvarum]MCM0594743.1 TetR/AcrR family transcriptional regulator [Weissella uvarum]
MKAREKIIKSTLDLLSGNQKNDFSVSEVVEKAGVHRSTFYRNFETKDDLILATIEYEIGGLADQKLSLRDYFIELYKIVDDNRSVLVALKDNERFEELVNQELMKQFKNLVETIPGEDVTMEAVRESKHQHRANLIMMDAMVGLIQMSVKYNREYKIEDILEVFDKLMV